MAERGNARRMISGLNPSSLSSRAELEKTLSDYSLPTDGTVPTLRFCRSNIVRVKVCKRQLNYNAGFNNPILKLLESDNSCKPGFLSVRCGEKEKKKPS